MKGIVLAGGLGTRLRPLTLVTNKHLLPIYNKPMVHYPIRTLLDAGVDEILLVTGGEHAGDFLKLLGNGKALGVRELRYTYQEGEGGIADALGLAEDFAEGGSVVVALGDNIFEQSVGAHVEAFEAQGSGARILLKEVPDPQRFGVASFDGDRVTRIVEKPAAPESPYAVVGLYMYDSRVFDIIRALTPSERGELEITDVNNDYLGRGELRASVLDGWWTDAGTFESLLRASTLVAKDVT